MADRLKSGIAARMYVSCMPMKKMLTVLRVRQPTFPRPERQKDGRGTCHAGILARNR